MKPGQNRHTTKRERIAAKLDELVAEYFPNGGYSVMDGNRLRLAARHFVIAESARDPNVSVRSVRTAEYLLNKLRPSALRPSAADDPAALALEHLLNRKLPGMV
jgi:hypothetical protein